MIATKAVPACKQSFDHHPPTHPPNSFSKIFRSSSLGGGAAGGAFRSAGGNILGRQQRLQSVDRPRRGLVARRWLAARARVWFGAGAAAVLAARGGRLLRIRRRTGRARCWRYAPARKSSARRRASCPTAAWRPAPPGAPLHIAAPDFHRQIAARGFFGRRISSLPSHTPATRWPV